MLTHNFNIILNELPKKSYSIVYMQLIMDILLICPQPKDILLTSYEERKTSLFHKIMLRLTLINKNLSLPILAALTPKKHTVLLQEGTYDDIDFDMNCDIVGITYTTFDALCAYKIADEFRRRGKTVVLGGWHASALPEEAKNHADCVVIGEAEDIWHNLLDDYEKGKLKPFYKQIQLIDPKKIPIPNFNLYKNNVSLGIQAARGCSIGCEFCAETNAPLRNVFRPRPVENVLEELRLKPQKSISFYDSSLTTNLNYTKSLFRGIRDLGLNKHFACYGNVNVLARDEELLKLANDAGVIQWHMGLESVIQESIDEVGKRSNKVEEYSLAIKKIHDYNMTVFSNFMFGFDNDPKNIGNITYDFVKELDIDIVDAIILTPFPGTPLFNRLEKGGRILTKDWSKYDSEHVVFEPKNMSPEDLLENAKTFFKKYYSVTNILKRTLKSIDLGFTLSTYVAFGNLSMATKRYV